MNIPVNSNKRRASVGALVAVTFVALLVLAIMFYQGRQAQGHQSELLASAQALILDQQPKEAYQLLLQADSLFGSSLSVYRLLLSSDQYLTQLELAELANNTLELIILNALSKAHDNLFNLTPSEDKISEALKYLEKLEKSDNLTNLRKSVDNLVFISRLCELYNEDQEEEALKLLFETDSREILADLDFFIFQIRFLIASGRKINEPSLVTQARELLFFATQNLDIDNEKTRSLWIILTSG